MRRRTKTNILLIQMVGLLTEMNENSFVFFLDIRIMDKHTIVRESLEKVSRFNCKMFAFERVCVPASLILLAYSQSYETMRNKSALSKNREGVWKSMVMPNNVLEHYTWLLKLDLKKKKNGVQSRESYLKRKGPNTDGWRK